MIQYNLDRLKSAPANRAYLDGFERMRCGFICEDGERCKLWKVEPGDTCRKHVGVLQTPQKYNPNRPSHMDPIP